eukprot:130941_1
MLCKIYDHAVISDATLIEYIDDDKKVKRQWISDAEINDYTSKKTDVKTLLKSQKKTFLNIAHPNPSTKNDNTFNQHSTILLNEFYWSNPYYFKYNYGYRSYIKLYRSVCVTSDISW